MERASDALQAWGLEPILRLRDHRAGHRSTAVAEAAVCSGRSALKRWHVLDWSRWQCSTLPPAAEVEARCTPKKGLSRRPFSGPVRSGPQVRCLMCAHVQSASGPWPNVCLHRLSSGDALRTSRRHYYSTRAHEPTVTWHHLGAAHAPTFGRNGMHRNSTDAPPRIRIRLGGAAAAPWRFGGCTVR